MSARILVFLGPTLPAQKAKALLPCELRGPAKRGDLFAAVDEHPDAIVLIDGLFEASPSVWHRELLAALDCGIRVYGAASMGALRAAELASHGMVGVGEIFEAYRSGALVDDAEVALLHAGADEDYQPMSVPLVNVRHAAAAALRSGALSRREARALVAAGEALFYQERHWPRMVETAFGAGTAARERWRRFAQRGPMDLKALDAEACLRRVAADRPLRRGAIRRRAVSSMERRHRLAPWGLSIDPVLRGPKLDAAAEEGQHWLLLAALARTAGLTVDARARAQAERRWLKACGVEPRQRRAFLEAVGFDASQLEAFLESMALAQAAVERAPWLVTDGPSRDEALAFEAYRRGLTAKWRR